MVSVSEGHALHFREYADRAPQGSRPRRYPSLTAAARSLTPSFP